MFYLPTIYYVLFKHNLGLNIKLGQLNVKQFNCSTKKEICRFIVYNWCIILKIKVFLIVIVFNVWIFLKFVIIIYLCFLNIKQPSIRK